MAEKKEKKGFFKEFSEFIARGNVLDMAVGVIIGGAFSAIVTALTNNILKPIINWILALCFGTGTQGIEGAYTFLVRVNDEQTGLINLEQSIYIDWGSFINAIINFLLIALILFLIIKTFNSVRRKSEELKEKAEKAKEEREAARLKEERTEEEKKAAIAAGQPSSGGGSEQAPTSGNGK